MVVKEGIKCTKSDCKKSNRKAWYQQEDYVSNVPNPGIYEIYKCYGCSKEYYRKPPSSKYLSNEDN